MTKEQVISQLQWIQKQLKNKYLSPATRRKCIQYGNELKQAYLKSLERKDKVK